MVKRFIKLAAIFALYRCAGWCSAQTCVTQSQVTLAGSLRGANGIPSSNYVMTLQPSQQGYIAGCGVNVATVVTCGTSVDGSVIGIPNPNTATINTTSGTGSLPAATYYTVYTFYDAAGHQTLVSPETRTTVSVTGSLVVNPPASGVPSNASGMQVYIATTSGGETLQGSTIGSASFVQSVPLASGTAQPGSNTTLCQLTANDSIWPTGTGYNIGLVDSSGNQIPGYPMQWQLIGPTTTINLSNGLPYYHGVVTYPTPILSAPQNHGAQSISGPINLGGYNLVNLGKIGVGTSTPGYPLDVESGLANVSAGYLVNGSGGTAGQCLGSDGAAYDTPIACITSASFFYQTVKSNSTAQTQRAALNFLPRFTLSDSASPAQTNVDLATTGVSAATYTLTYNGTSYNNYAVDAYGRVTGTNNIVLPSMPVTQSLIVTSGFCTTANTAYAQCSFSPTWSTAFADTNYAVNCSPASIPSGTLTALLVSAKSTTGFTLTLQNGTSSGAVATTLTEVDCIGRHL